MKFSILMLSLVGIILVFTNPILAAAPNTNNVTVEQKSGICLNESFQILYDLAQQNFSVLRVNESLRQAQSLFNAQEVLKERGKPSDFSSIIPYCAEIKNINDAAFNAKDEFVALIKFYNESANSGMNTSEIDKTVEEIIQEIKSERYEKVAPLINKAYDQIITARSSQTTLNLFYKNTTRGFKEFLYRNGIYLISFVFILLILTLVYSKGISRWYINRKIDSLEVRKKTLRELIMQTQKDYFQLGSVADGVYQIRIKKFAQLIRDVDRQIPLLKEQLIKVTKKEPVKLSKK